MTQTDLSIVIPCFNEKDNLSVVLNTIVKHIQKSPISCEVIVVDGGSNDGSQQWLQQTFDSLDKNIFKLYLMDVPGGYGHDIMYGIHQASGAVLSWTHADLQTDPTDIFKAYDIYKHHATPDNPVFVKGKRKNRRFMEAFFTLGMQIMTLFILRKYLDDINAQPKCFSRDFYQQHLKTGYPMDFSLDLYALYKACENGYQIHTLPVYFKKRLHGQAKGGGGGWKSRMRLIKRTFVYIIKLRKMV